MDGLNSEGPIACCAGPGIVALREDATGAVAGKHAQETDSLGGGAHACRLIGKLLPEVWANPEMMRPRYSLGSERRI
jgi:hypothetical protein